MQDLEKMDHIFEIYGKTSKNNIRSTNVMRDHCNIEICYNFEFYSIIQIFRYTLLISTLLTQLDSSVYLRTTEKSIKFQFSC